MQTEAPAGIFLVVGGVFRLVSYNTVLAHFSVCWYNWVVQAVQLTEHSFLDNILEGSFVAVSGFLLLGFVIFC
jgi:hypothetical protein